MTRVPLGVTPTPVRLNPVETWLNWPAGNAKQWLQWNWGSYNTGSKTVSGHIKFNPSTNIAIAKYNATSPGGASQYVFTNYANEQAAIGSPGTYVPLMNWYDGDMNIVKAGTAGAVYYGHGTLTIRHRPEVWYQYRSDVNCDDVYTGTADCYLGPNVWARSLVTLKQNYTGVDETFDIQSAIAIPIINGDSSGHQLRVNGNLQADANNGFAGRVSVNQNRLTGWWEWNNEPEWDWWDVQWGNPVTYGGTGAYHNFDPNEAFTYAIMARIACNASGHKGDVLGCRVWPQVLNLYL
ncbi:MAG: hypothetical protein WCP21_03585 [Armatimonadota bacterium]